MTTTKPFCFVLMPFGTRPAAGGRVIRFDDVYEKLIRAAVIAAGLEPIRADEERVGGVIHTPMFERLLLCEYAVADLTTANANVFYELGVRHAARPRSTVLLFAEEAGQLPFDVRALRALPYRLAEDGSPADVESAVTALAQKLRSARGAERDSPLYQLLQDYPNIAHEKTDVFRDRVLYSENVKRRLAQAREAGAAALDAIKAIERELEPLADAEAGAVVDLLLSYRAVSAWVPMVELVDRMSPPLRESVLVQEQLGFALNRAGRAEEAERVLMSVITKHGPSSETYGLLGRVYKDRWEQARKAGDEPLARGLLKKAVQAYQRGFEADWRDAYPGINAVTLMELMEPPHSDRHTLLPVVRYAVERKIATGKPDYWDFATRLELAVLASDANAAEDALAEASACVREAWEPRTTARNVRLVREARERRSVTADWLVGIEDSLERAAHRVERGARNS